MNICWFCDDEIEIYLDRLPNLSIRYPKPNDSLVLVQEINKKPFINLSDLNVLLLDKINDNQYDFLIKRDYVWDGASIPKIFWKYIGAKTDNKFLIPSLIHDVLCENHDYINSDRYFSSCVFDCLLQVSKVKPFNRWIIKHCVDNYQKVFGKWEK